MAKRVIVLAADLRSVTAALWAAVPAATQAFYANPLATSVWPGASATEVLAIRDGSILERVERFVVTGRADARAQLEARWTELQAQVASRDPLVDQGRYWDDQGWH